MLDFPMQAIRTRWEPRAFLWIQIKTDNAQMITEDCKRLFLECASVDEGCSHSGRVIDVKT